MVTQELLRRAQEEFSLQMNDVADGCILEETADKTAMNAAEIYGHMQGLKFFMEFRGDDPEEKEEDKPSDNRSFTWTEP